MVNICVCQGRKQDSYRGRGWDGVVAICLGWWYGINEFQCYLIRHTIFYQIIPSRSLSVSWEYVFFFIFLGITCSPLLVFTKGYIFVCFYHLTPSSLHPASNPPPQHWSKRFPLVSNWLLWSKRHSCPFHGATSALRCHSARKHFTVHKSLWNQFHQNWLSLHWSNKLDPVIHVFIIIIIYSILFFFLGKWNAECIRMKVDEILNTPLYLKHQGCWEINAYHLWIWCSKKINREKRERRANKKKSREREKERERERRQSFEIGNFVFLFESNQKESKRENKRENTSKLVSIYIKK